MYENRPLMTISSWSLPKSFTMALSLRLIPLLVSKLRQLRGLLRAIPKPLAYLLKIVSINSNIVKIFLKRNGCTVLGTGGYEGTDGGKNNEYLHDDAVCVCVCMWGRGSWLVVMAGCVTRDDSTGTGDKFVYSISFYMHDRLMTHNWSIIFAEDNTCTDCMHLPRLWKIYRLCFQMYSSSVVGLQKGFCIFRSLICITWRRRRFLRFFPLVDLVVSMTQQRAYMGIYLEVV